MEYASPVWFLHATSDINYLDAVQNRAACWACGSRWHREKKKWFKSTSTCLNHLQWLLFMTGESILLFVNYIVYFMDSRQYHFMNTFTSQKVKHNLIPCLLT